MFVNNSKMSITVYKNINFQGVFSRLESGLYRGRDLVGCHNMSNSCEDLDNLINSIRVDANTVVCIADNHVMTASGGSRILIGPIEIPDLSVLGMDNRISSILITSFRAFDSATSVPTRGVIITDGYNMTGRRAELRRGDYTLQRLSSEEVKFSGNRVLSLNVATGVIVIIYAGLNFDNNLNAQMIIGPKVIEDINTIGMLDGVNSIRVLYGDPFDIPNRPKLNYGQYFGKKSNNLQVNNSSLAPIRILQRPQEIIYINKSVNRNFPIWMIIAFILIIMLVIVSIILIILKKNKT